MGWRELPEERRVGVESGSRGTPDRSKNDGHEWDGENRIENGSQLAELHHWEHMAVA